jgi:3-phenylpropionate/trans-cinnamate dioxygenase ferredoxin reductase subunit
MSKHLVVVGGGQAAVQIIHTTRKLGFDGTLTLICDEPFMPYQRPPLSKKYLAGSFPRERLFLKPDHFYRDKGVDTVLSSTVSEIDLNAQRVVLADGRQLSFDKLALATGSHARHLPVPGSELAGVHYIRSIADIDALRAEIEPGRKLVIVGAGYIGLEAAATGVELGLDVTVIEAAPRVLSRVVSSEVAAFFADCHARAGVRICCNAVVEQLVGTARVVGVRTADGEHYDADIVVIGIGAAPNTALAERAGLACENGIAVDTLARTSHQNVVAAGDCTSHAHPFAPHRVRLESVNNAVEQGKAAAASVLDQSMPFEDVPWFWSDQYDLKLQIAGLAIDYDEVVLRGKLEDRHFAAYYLRQGRPIAVDAVNSPRDFMNAKKLIAARPLISADVLADPEADLRPYLSPA